MSETLGRKVLGSDRVSDALLGETILGGAGELFFRRRLVACRLGIGFALLHEARHCGASKLLAFRIRFARRRVCGTADQQQSNRYSDSLHGLSPWLRFI